ncbi:hypothetical protein GGD50_002370 [Rhizobium paranaense]|uniref:Uncharacterized protein n=1 Tax=Rhizobium paranaense TaxID=1650438 RepID=A0A7W8XQJ0_9HYPH|nr:hypothetical protein [Rhizobium paranaense]
MPEAVDNDRSVIHLKGTHFPRLTRVLHVVRQ